MEGKQFALNLFFIFILNRIIEAQNCFLSSSSSQCLNYFKVPSCPCTGSYDVLQQINQDIATLKNIISKIEQRDPSSCFYFNDTSIKYPPSCCALPFTLNGELHFHCVPGQNTEPGCFLPGRTWVPCTDPNYIVNFQTFYLSIPTFNDLIPTPSVNGWIVFQQRINPDETFNRNWTAYRDGFGNRNNNFWLGLEKVHQLCSRGNCQLRIEVYSTRNEWVSQEHPLFFLTSEDEEYAIHLIGSSGDGNDYFSPLPNSNGVINGMRFTTRDKDHDTRPTENCAVLWGGGWWYNNCCWYNLNGMYGTKGFSGGNGIKKLTISRMMLKFP